MASESRFEALRTILVEPSSLQARIIGAECDEIGLRQVERVGTIAEALDTMLRARPDLVLSALYLPDGTGTELVEAMGTTVRFTPLWVDRSSVGDVTPLGPSLALAPWVCGSELVLAPAPRLAGAGAEEPSDGLRAATGVYAIADDELQRRAAAPDLGTWTRVAVDLP